MSDQIIDAAMARSLHDDASRTHLLFGWVVMRDPPDHPGKGTARLVIDTPSFYVLVADTLAELRAQLPPIPDRSERQPADLPEMVEVWFSR